MDLDNEYRHFDDSHEEEAAEKLNIKRGAPYYHDIIHDELCEMFQEKMEARFELLLTRPEERVAILKELVGRLESELKDNYVEKHAHASIETLLLLRMLKPELEAFGRLAARSNKKNG